MTALSPSSTSVAVSSSPRIGISSLFDLESNRYALTPAYVRAIEAAGGLPLVLPYCERPGWTVDLLESLDGLLLTGGHDFDPELFGAEPHPSMSPIIAERDAFEFALIGAALDSDLPVLGICRGAQVLNVALGGTLIADLPTFAPEAGDHRPGLPLDEFIHSVTIKPDSRLVPPGGHTDTRVNSHHHQAIDVLGRDLEAVAWASDGVIEAIESRRHRFVVGVQWHPEEIFEHEPLSRGAFATFVAEAAVAARPSADPDPPPGR